MPSSLSSEACWADIGRDIVPDIPNKAIQYKYVQNAVAWDAVQKAVAQ